jgi:hypothetical protein
MRCRVILVRITYFSYFIVVSDSALFPETPNPEIENTNPIDGNANAAPSPSPQPEGEHHSNPIKKEEEKHMEKKKAKERQQPMTDFTLINAEGFEPFVTHQPHEPVPIAMVNRAPHGCK